MKNVLWSVCCLVDGIVIPYIQSICNKNLFISFSNSTPINRDYVCAFLYVYIYTIWNIFLYI